MVDLQNFPIPDELTPDTFCLCIQVPNNPIWIHTFVGLLAQPTYWFNWDRDEARSGKILAQYWTKLFDQIDWSTMSCCCDQPPAIFRYTDDGVYQISFDSGATWTDAPGYDYRNTSTIFPPPSSIGITNTKCQAADGVVATIKVELVQALDETFAAAQILALIAAILLAILSAGSLAAFTPLITAIGAAILDVGVSATQAAFTDDVWNRFRCNIYLHMDSDTSINAAGVAAVLAQLLVDETGIVQTVLYGMVNAAGVVGITNMIRSNRGDPDANCDDCDCMDGCTVEWTFYGVTDVVKLSDCHYTMTRDTSGGHFAFSSGDDTLGCYFYNPPGTEIYTQWSVGSPSPTNENPRTHLTWNFDSGGVSNGDPMDIVFSSAPL
jgi:hypothetical protein